MRLAAEQLKRVTLELGGKSALIVREDADIAQAVELARLPKEIRGYGHVKERHAKAAQQKWQQLLAAWRAA